MNFLLRNNGTELRAIAQTVSRGVMISIVKTPAPLPATWTSTPGSSDGSGKPQEDGQECGGEGGAGVSAAKTAVVVRPQGTSSEVSTISIVAPFGCRFIDWLIGRQLIH